MPFVDVVVVSYNSRDRLRSCVEPLCALPNVHVIVADNASPDRSLEAVADLPVTALALARNGGFAHGVNAGVAAGESPYVLLLNPDARIDESSLSALVAALERDEQVAAAAPRVVDDAGAVDFSQRRFPRLRSTFAQALFLHRIARHADWADELVRDPDAYERPGAPEWVSGACILLRRSALERIGGLDDGFFMYCEDVDLCRRLWNEGFEIRFVPAATVVHEGGASAPRASLLPTLAASRIRYARKHRSRPAAELERIGIVLGSLTHALAGRGGPTQRAGHARALRAAVSAR